MKHTRALGLVAFIGGGIVAISDAGAQGLTAPKAAAVAPAAVPKSQAPAAAPARATPATVTKGPVPAANAGVWGFADLHVHPATHFAFGADASGNNGPFWGKPGGRLEDANQSLPEDLKACANDKHLDSLLTRRV